MDSKLYNLSSSGLPVGRLRLISLTFINSKTTLSHDHVIPCCVAEFFLKQLVFPSSCDFNLLCLLSDNIVYITLTHSDNVVSPGPMPGNDYTVFIHRLDSIPG